MLSLRRQLLSITVCFSLTLAPLQSAWSISVFDSANFSQNLLTAVRSLQQINNQIASLQNEAQMLINMARHLERMDYSALSQINRAIAQINLMMQQAEGIAFDVNETDRIFRERYPERYDDLTSNDKLTQDAQARWRHSMEAYRHTMRVQAHISESVAADQALIGDLLAASQASVGSLQAQQATNQLLALSIQQQAKTQQLLVGQFRADALTQARRAAEQERVRARLSRFIGDGKAYTPLD